MRDLTIALTACMTLLAACEQHTASQQGQTMVDTTHSMLANGQDWQRLATLKVAYGHQSVGEQVISSIEAEARANHVSVSIAENRDAFAAPGLHHFRIGINGDPHGKIEDFKKAMSQQIAGSADVALMELCYVDFDADTKAQQLAQQYIAEIDQLAARFPNTTFVPVTALLTTVQTGPKALVKKLLGREPAGYAENARRQEFNDVLRAHYASSKILFDVAAVESRNGNVTIERKGTRVEVLDTAFTSDGGHLNERGKQLVSDALVHHLATVAAKESMGS